MCAPRGELLGVDECWDHAHDETVRCVQCGDGTIASTPFAQYHQQLENGVHGLAL